MATDDAEQVGGPRARPVGAGQVVRRRARLRPEPESARKARQVVADTLARARRDDLAEAAELLVSELVTNAIVHARTPIELGVQVGPRGLRVAVRDGSSHLPSPRHYGRNATTGRGLELVAMMADRHGTDTDPKAGKTVWFELGAAAREEGGPVSAQPQNRADAPGPVTLLGLPVVLALAWRQHADTLLRENLLAQWEDDEDGDRDDAAAPAGHAHDAFAVLAAALGALDPGDPPARADLRLTVARDEVAGFGALSELLDDILARAERGQTLAPPTQPEVRLLRRWMCEQVLAQAGSGAAPGPWPGLPSELERSAAPGPVWDVEQVRRETAAMVAADDVNRIIAASPAALALLGWDESLVGQRIGAIIPDRMREAHIAGFTTHLLTGESRILDREVTVPALRRDGTEVSVRLTVSRISVPDGRNVFTATFQAA